MAFSAKRISREMEVQVEKALPCLNPFPMVKPLSSPLYASAWSSRSTLVFESCMSTGHGAIALFGGSKRGREMVEMEFLFSKSLTASDVSKKFNHLLIPRQCAEGFFPKISEAKCDEDSIFLNFEDSYTGLIWHFLFGMWTNRKTYILTKGWPAFIKEKNLKKGDIVSFYRDAGVSRNTNHFFIRIKPNVGITSMQHPKQTPVFSPSGLLNGDSVPRGFGFGRSLGIVPAWKPTSFGSWGLMPPTNLMQEVPTFPKSTSLENCIGREKKHLRLFGVNIDISP